MTTPGSRAVGSMANGGSLRSAAVVCAALLSLAISDACADPADFVAQYNGKRLTKSRTIEALTPGLFGDQVSLKTGDTEFRVTDLSLEGNNALPMNVSRRYTMRGERCHQQTPCRTETWSALGDWELELPHMYGTFAQQTGWQVPGSAPDSRCSVVSAGPWVDGPYSSYGPHQYGQGIKLRTPGGSDEEMLKAPADRVKPTDGKAYPWITKSMWRVSCLPQLKSGQAGEGFLAVSPDGTKYYFDWMSKRRANVIATWSISDFWGPTEVLDLYRDTVAIYPTRIEDRFGNHVTISYNAGHGRPSRMDASDGRFISFNYNTAGRIASVNSSAGTWTYVYDDFVLRQVVQPDASRWEYGMVRVFPLDGKLTMNGCDPYVNWHPTAAGSYTSTITHPSGATGRFEFRRNRFKRDNVPWTCFDPNIDVDGDEQTDHPQGYETISLFSKEISGPGLNTGTWTYRYINGIDNVFPPAGTTITEVTQPTGDVHATGFGNRFNQDDGLTLWTEVRDGNGVVKQREDTTYQLSTTGAWCFGPVGQSLNVFYDSASAERLRPMLSRMISRDGATFGHTVQAYDSAFCRANNVVKASTIAGNPSRTEATVHHDNLSKWVLGQVEKSTTNSVVTSETYYDPTTALPVWNKSFGKLQQTLTYNPDGTLATAKDGRNFVTALSNWKRGIPQLITYPDGTSQSAVVDNRGWISSVTDENGFQTNYTYDVMGRMASVVYPSSDTVAWNTTTQAFAQIGSSEYGIAAGHWRQTVSTGNGRKQVYFDALWRPVVTREYDAGNVTATERFTRNGYDAKGRASFASYPGTTDALTKGTHTTYDALDRVTSVAQNSELGVLTTKTDYLTGFQTKTTNPRGKSTLTTIYQAYDEPSYDLPRGINHPEGAYTEIHRDLFGKPTQLKRRNADGSLAATRWFVYDAHQQLCKTIEPETGSTVMSYDLAGNLAWSAAGLALPDSSKCNNGTLSFDSGRRVDRSYDARNRISALTFPDGLGNTSYSYTPDGLLASITAYNANDAITTSYAYNKRRLMTDETRTWGTPLGYTYDANGHLASEFSGGFVVSYAPNALGQPTQAGTYASGVSYFPNGAIKQFTYGNGIVHTLTQNARQLPDTSRDAYGTTKYLDDGYDYDGNGNVAAISDGLPAARGNRTMSYDGLDRLTTTASPMYGTAGAAYSYDVLDNLRTVKAPDRSHTYLYDATQRLTNVTDTATGATVIGLGYDVQGNLANKNGQGFVFDYGNRLRSVSGVGTYVYDGHGRRVRDTTTASKISQYNATGRLVYTTDARTAVNGKYVYLGSSLVAIRERHGDASSGYVFIDKYQHTDALGTPVAVTDANRNVIERSEYEPYGKRLASSSTPTVKDGVGYTGHVEDAATGMTYMQQRYYDSGIGRILSVDPVTANGNTGGNFNRYWYANNNPYKFTDPDGRLARNRIDEIHGDDRPPIKQCNHGHICYGDGGSGPTSEGKRQIEKAWRGIAAHKIIQADVALTLPGIEVRAEHRTLNPLSGGFGRVDLMLRSSSNAPWSVFEIKPGTQQGSSSLRAAATSQINRYVDSLNAEGTRAVVGNWSSFFGREQNRAVNTPSLEIGGVDFGGSYLYGPSETERGVIYYSTGDAVGP